MNKVEFETIHQGVIDAVEDLLLSNPQCPAFNILIKTRTNKDYKISEWKALSRVNVVETENNYKLLDLALLVVYAKYVTAIPYNEIVEIYAEAVKK